MVRNHRQVKPPANRYQHRSPGIRGRGNMSSQGSIDFPLANGWSGVRGGTATPSVFPGRARRWPPPIVAQRRVPPLPLPPETRLTHGKERQPRPSWVKGRPGRRAEQAKSACPASS